MRQLHCHVADDVAENLKKKAHASHLSVSEHLARLIERDVVPPWPQDYFQCFGGWQGDPLYRPPQAHPEKRQRFD